MCTCVQQNLFSNFRSFREFLIRSNNCDPFCSYGSLNRVEGNVDGKCFYLDLVKSARICTSTCLESVNNFKWISFWQFLLRKWSIFVYCMCDIYANTYFCRRDWRKIESKQRIIEILKWILTILWIFHMRVGMFDTFCSFKIL